MRAWHVETPGPVTGHPLSLHTDDEIPRPGPGELLLRVRACGVCRTDLHVTEGDLPPHRRGVTPGHEVVGEVADLGEGVTTFKEGDRAGAAWLRWTDGTCKFCLREAENLCPHSLYTGWDADGGYAEFMTVPAAYAHRLPDGIPLLGQQESFAPWPPGHLRLRRQRAPGYSGGAGPRRHRARDDPR